MNAPSAKSVAIIDAQLDAGDSPYPDAMAYAAALLARGRHGDPAGYAPDFVASVRERASDSLRAAAAVDIAKRLDAPPKSHRKAGPLHLRDIHLFLADDPAAVCRQLAERAYASQADWDKGPWGMVHALMGVMRKLMVTPECQPESLIPILAWLIEQGQAEWQWARTWDENMLGDLGHNWYQHSYLGYLQAGIYLPELACFRRFRGLGREWVEHETLRLFETDGFSIERSGYHYASVNLFLEAVRTADRLPGQWSTDFLQRRDAILATSWQTTSPYGSVHMMGDGHHSYRNRYSRDLLRLAAAITGDPRPAHVAQSLEPDWQPDIPAFLPFDGQNYWPEFAAVTTAEPARPADTALPRSGYYFMRQSWAPSADYACIDIGPRRDTKQHHDHSSLLGFELYSRGEPVLVDNGTGPYGDSPERNWRISAAAHNTTTVDDTDPLPLARPWRWQRPVVPVLNAWRSEADFAYVAGAHDGFRDLPEPVISAQRKLFYLRGGYWILIDRFIPATDVAHLYTQHFNSLGGCELDSATRVCLAGDGRLQLIPLAIHDDALPEAAVSPCPHPLPDYDNPDQLRYTIRRGGPTVMATLLVPADLGVPTATALPLHCDDRVLAPHEGTAIQIDFADHRHAYVDLHMEWSLPWRAADHSGQSRLFHSACPSLAPAAH